MEKMRKYHSKIYDDDINFKYDDQKQMYLQ